jgi:hypothetical protein
LAASILNYTKNRPSNINSHQDRTGEVQPGRKIAPPDIGTRIAATGQSMNKKRTTTEEEEI